MRSVVAAVILAWNLGGTWTELQSRQTNLDNVAATLTRESQPGDLVLVSPWYLAVTLARSYDGPGTLLSIPPIDDHTISRYDLLKARMLEDDPIAPIRAAIQTALQSGARVWYVGELLMVSPGTILPKLPRPPAAESGWNSAPYETLWELQVGEFLRDHAFETGEIKSSVEGGRLEHAPVHVFARWR